MIKSMITKGDLNGFLILSKKGINDLFINPDKYDYKIIQIEPGSDDDYIVEVVKKDSGTISDLDNVVINMCGNKGDETL